MWCSFISISLWSMLQLISAREYKILQGKEMPSENKTEIKGIRMRKHCEAQCDAVKEDCRSVNFNVKDQLCTLIFDDVSFPKDERLLVKRGCSVYSQTAKSPAKNINECDSSPCQNGGSCNDGVDLYSCLCSAGYLGDNCEIDKNECDSNPCQNGGACNNLINSYACSCLSGYDGDSCETDINECDSNPCQNGGACNNLINSYSCSCSSGYDGDNCETDINECGSIPCQNDGACTDGLSSYICVCPENFSGDNCETNDIIEVYVGEAQKFWARKDTNTGLQEMFTVVVEHGLSGSPNTVSLGATHDPGLYLGVGPADSSGYIFEWIDPNSEANKEKMTWRFEKFGSYTRLQSESHPEYYFRRTGGGQLAVQKCEAPNVATCELMSSFAITLA